jgi:hypothetical protein
MQVTLRFAVRAVFISLERVLISIYNVSTSGGNCHVCVNEDP